MKTQITKEIAQKMLESNEPSLKEFALLNFPELGKKQLPKRWAIANLSPERAKKLFYALLIVLFGILILILIYL